MAIFLRLRQAIELRGGMLEDLKKDVQSLLKLTLFAHLLFFVCVLSQA